MLNKVLVSAIAAMIVVMVAPAGADSVFISDARDAGGKLDIRSYQVSKGGGVLYLKQCMHRPFYDDDLAGGNHLTADLRITNRDGYVVTTTFRGLRLRGWLIPYLDGKVKPRLGLRVKVDRLNSRCVESVIPRSQVWTQGALRLDTRLTSFYEGTTDSTPLPTR
ncbi:MAG: hypothetical protein ACRDKT_12555 [Actinomycetota bacterium]